MANCGYNIVVDIVRELTRRKVLQAIAACSLFRPALGQPQEAARGLQLPTAQEPVAGVRRALVIGNRAYKTSPLVTPANDAVDMGDRLKRLRFDTDVVIDGTKPKMQAAIDAFVSKLGPGDVAIFFYAGHGLQIDAANYMVPVEFDAGNEAQARQNSVHFDAVKQRLERSAAAMILMVLDSCRNNPFATAKTSHGLALLEASLGSYIAFAASPGKTASDNAGERNGLFTKHLLASLSQPIPISVLFRKVRQDVFTASGQRQLPYLHDQVIADFSLAEGVPAKPSGKAPATAVSGDARRTVDSLDEGKTLLQNGRCEEAIQAIDKIIRRQPDNAFAHNALGLAYGCQALRVQAARHFSMAIDLKPDYGAAYLNRGDIFLATAQYELAIQDFTWAVEQEPENAIMRWRLGRARLGLRRYEEAMEDFSEAIRLDPSDPHGYHGRGQVYHVLGKLREALADFDDAVIRKKDAVDFYRDRARTRDRMGDKSGAAEDRAKSIQSEKKK